MDRIEPGNIWSGSETLADFTTANELAYKKGTINKRYPIIYKGKEYLDVERAHNRYKNNKSVEKRVELLIDLLCIKLTQYPELFEAIKYNGGISWLNKCSHITKLWENNSIGLWEGKGKKSLFIICLIKAYERALSKQLINK